MSQTPPEDYPEHWEADAVLRDGSVCHLRPIRADDDDLLREFHGRLSSETVYYRFFHPYPELTDKDVRRFTQVDYVNRVALVATVAGLIVGVGRYDKVNATDAEIAFTVRDDYQGRGLGSVLLEHIAAVARERGIRRFLADVLPGNRRMVGTFSAAGYHVAQELDEGIIKLAFEIESTQTLRSVMQAREQRAEARSVERLMTPAAVAVVGASRRTEALGNVVLRNLLEGGFTGRLYPIHPEASMVAGVPAYRTVADVPGPVDLVVVVVPVDQVQGVVQESAKAGVHGLIVISSGFSDAGEEGTNREQQLVSLVRGHGMRLVGPNALGIINTDPRSKLRAAVPNLVPPRGRVAFYGQSAALSVSALDRLAQRKLGLSTFVSTGNRADVSAHDLLQYWTEDGQTAVVLLYLESMATPSKFIRVARNVTLHKPMVMVRSGRTSQSFPLGARPRRTELPAIAVDQLLRNAGVIETSSLGQLVDVGGILACQPLPRGRRLTVLGDSHELVQLAADTSTSAGFHVNDPVFLRGGNVARGLRQALAEEIDDDRTDAILVVHVPPARSSDQAVREVLVAAAASATMPVVAVLHAEEGNNALLPVPGPDGAVGHGSVPYFGTVEEAVSSLRLVSQYAQWRRRPLGEVPELTDVDAERARVVVEDALAGDVDVTPTIPLVGTQLAHLLAAYGVELWESLPVSTEDEAVAQADELGWPVALKSLDPRLVRRGEISGVRLNLENEQSLRAAFLSLAATLDGAALSRLVVQRMALPGIHVVVRTQEDAMFGPVVSFGVGGAVAELLGDRAYQVPPMSDTDAARLIRDCKAASILFGYGGRTPVDIPALEDLIVRLGRMADELPQLARLDLNPVIVGRQGLSVLGASAWLRAAEARDDSAARRLPEA